MSKCVQTQRYPFAMIRVVHRCQEVMRYPVEMFKVVRRCLDVSRHRNIQLTCSALFTGIKKCSDTEVSS